MARQGTAKELDEETGLYYYGARYLDPKYSMWISTDPALGEYIPQAPINDEAKKNNQNLPGMGGVFNHINSNLYHYAGNNPVKYTDPTGRWFGADDVFTGPIDEIVVLGALTIIGAVSIYNSDANKNFSDALAESFTYNFNKIKDLFTNDEKISGENSAAAPSPLSPDPDDDSDDNNDNNLEDNKKYREKTRNANANDRKQVDSIAKKFKINRREFGDFIEDTKQSMGRKPSDNFTYKELEILAKEFMELQ